ncbi:hypothetical protein CRM22_005576 [Opisthorchis felineus]|uniref:Uncharacterized protein n=1 Tax=Opisthorchis felineus TaxID=147828 RepID=A0A4S2LXD9_OPIFE|nr:hypothetical protein CRM22_005576 [Opisthorchis felineus]
MLVIVDSITTHIRRYSINAYEDTGTARYQSLVTDQLNLSQHWSRLGCTSFFRLCCENAVQEYQVIRLCHRGALPWLVALLLNP